MAITIIIYGLSQHGFHSMLLMLKQRAKNTHKIANEKLGTKRVHEGENCAENDFLLPFPTKVQMVRLLI